MKWWWEMEKAALVGKAAVQGGSECGKRHRWAVHRESEHTVFTMHYRRLQRDGCEKQNMRLVTTLLIKPYKTTLAKTIANNSIIHRNIS